MSYAVGEAATIRRGTAERGRAHHTWGFDTIKPSMKAVWGTSPTNVFSAANRLDHAVRRATAQK